MKFEHYYNSLGVDKREELADKLDTSVGYLYQLATGRRQAGPKFLLGIEAATNGAVSPGEMRGEN